jgi:hypothetical protein
MKINSLSTAFTTNKVAESRDFYIKYLDAKVTFDCGWYVNLEFGNESSDTQVSRDVRSQKPKDRDMLSIKQITWIYEYR